MPQNTSPYEVQVREALQRADEARRRVQEGQGAEWGEFVQAYEELRAVLEKGLDGGLIGVRADRPGDLTEEQIEYGVLGPEDELLTLNDAAPLIGVSRPSLSANVSFYRDQGVVFMPVGKRVKVSRKSIELYQRKLREAALRRPRRE